MTVSAGAATVFGWFQTLTTITSLITWISILIAYLKFYYACKAQGVDRNTMPMKSWGQPYVAYITLAFFILIVFFNGFAVFTKGNWNIKVREYPQTCTAQTFRLIMRPELHHGIHLRLHLHRFLRILETPLQETVCQGLGS